MIRKLISCILFLFLAVSATAQLGPGSFSTVTTQKFRVGANATYITDTKITSIGADSTSTTKYATIRAITAWANGKLAELFNYINTADTVFTDGTLRWSGGLLGISPNRYIIMDTVQVKQLIGASPTPIATANTGSGSTSSSTTISNTGTDLAGEVTITASATPALGFSIFYLEYSRHYMVNPYVIITPSNSAAAGISGVWVSRTNYGFSLYSTTTNLVSGTTYKWSYIVIQ